MSCNPLSMRSQGNTATLSGNGLKRKNLHDKSIWFNSLTSFLYVQRFPVLSATSATHQTNSASGVIHRFSSVGNVSAIGIESRNSCLLFGLRDYKSICPLLL